MVIPIRRLAVALMVAAPVLAVAPLVAQLVDRTTAPNAANEGIALTLDEEIGAGRGDWFTEDSSAFIISRDPFRAIRRGRQLFQRKFTFARGQGPAMGDGAGDIGTNKAIGAGTGRQLRRLPWPPARRGRFRRRRRHPARQPRCAAPVRSRHQGDAC